MTVTDNLRDAAYIMIGMGVIGVQRAQVRREELLKQVAEQRAAFETRGGEAVQLLNEAVKQADANVSKVLALTPVGQEIEKFRQANGLGA